MPTIFSSYISHPFLTRFAGPNRRKAQETPEGNVPQERRKSPQQSSSTHTGPQNSLLRGLSWGPFTSKSAHSKPSSEGNALESRPERSNKPFSLFSFRPSTSKGSQTVATGNASDPKQKPAKGTALTNIKEENSNENLLQTPQEPLLNAALPDPSAAVSPLPTPRMPQLSFTPHRTRQSSVAGTGFPTGMSKGSLRSSAENLLHARAGKISDSEDTKTESDAHISLHSYSSSADLVSDDSEVQAERKLWEARQIFKQTLRKKQQQETDQQAQIPATKQKRINIHDHPRYLSGDSAASTGALQSLYSTDNITHGSGEPSSDSDKPPSSGSGKPNKGSDQSPSLTFPKQSTQRPSHSRTSALATMAQKAKLWISPENSWVKIQDAATKERTGRIESQVIELLTKYGPMDLQEKQMALQYRSAKIQTLKRRFLENQGLLENTSLKDLLQRMQFPAHFSNILEEDPATLEEGSAAPKEMVRQVETLNQNRELSVHDKQLEAVERQVAKRHYQLNVIAEQLKTQRDEQLRKTNHEGQKQFNMWLAQIEKAHAQLDAAQKTYLNKYYLPGVRIKDKYEIYSEAIEQKKMEARRERRQSLVSQLEEVPKDPAKKIALQQQLGSFYTPSELQQAQKEIVSRQQDDPNQGSRLQILQNAESFQMTMINNIQMRLTQVSSAWLNKPEDWKKEESGKLSQALSQEFSRLQLTLVKQMFEKNHSNLQASGPSAPKLRWEILKDAIKLQKT